MLDVLQPRLLVWTASDSRIGVKSIPWTLPPCLGEHVVVRNKCRGPGGLDAANLVGAF